MRLQAHGTLDSAVKVNGFVQIFSSALQAEASGASSEGKVILYRRVTGAANWLIPGKVRKVRPPLPA